MGQPKVFQRIARSVVEYMLGIDGPNPSSRQDWLQVEPATFSNLMQGHARMLGFDASGYGAIAPAAVKHQGDRLWQRYGPPDANVKIVFAPNTANGRTTFKMATIGETMYTPEGVWSPEGFKALSEARLPVSRESLER